MSTETVSPEQIESARMAAARIESEILRAVARVTQAYAAACMGVSPSTVSRMLEDLPRWAMLMASADIQTAPGASVVTDEIEMIAMESMVEKYLRAKRLQREKRGMP